jgi:hypothetical protein
MFNMKMNFDRNSLNSKIQELMQRKANEIINQRMAPLKDEIAKEPQGQFVGRMQGDSLIITAQGFSPELTEKINALLR